MDNVGRSRHWLPGRSLVGSAVAGMAALGIDLRPAQARAWALRIAEATQVPSVCPYCAVGCDTMIYAQDGVILDIEGDPNSPVNQGTLCPKGAAIYQLHVNPNRMTQVLYRRPGGTAWESIGLEEAMDMVAERVKKTRDETFAETYAFTNADGETEEKIQMATTAIFSLGGATIDNEWNHLQQKLMRGLGVVAIENQARI
jgi:formate dehydrogenase major subunit